jgi:phospholipid/cholesterol/gamma-HCH transport system permease protein
MAGSVTFEGTVLRLSGVIGSEDLPAVQKQLDGIVAGGPRPLTIDLSGCKGLDTLAGATLFDRLRALSRQGYSVEYSGLPADAEASLESFKGFVERFRPVTASRGFRSQMEEIGEKVSELAAMSSGLWKFTGRTFAALAAIPGNLRLLRLQQVFYYMEQSGVRGVPIISTLCWMLGVILGFQAGYQLKSFAAELYMPDLIAYSMTWEIAPMLAAVLVAGRSGSAFAAELGTMKVRQEIDALSVMGFDVWSYLVTPKMLALLVVMPFLVLLADFFGLLGGLLVGGWYLNMPASVYLNRLDTVMLPLDIYWGMLKSLVFAVIIANVGCFMGMRVRGGAAEVGRATTSAVVTGIFLVIVADALISLLFIHIRPVVSV